MHHSSVLKESAPPQPSHERHRPEKTLLYRIIDRYYPEFRAYMAEQGRPLPRHVQKEFEEFLKCGRLEHGFLRVQCSSCHKERLVAFSCKKRGFRLKAPTLGAPVAAQGAWPKVLACWWTKSFLMSRCANYCHGWHVVEQCRSICRGC